jgi:mannose-1-phosphate guanylyltransferase/mannose-6-phosphate isomerase
MTPIILCGGSGTRLWPLSRSQYPKQYLKLLDEEYSLFQQTIQRLAKDQSLKNLICLTNEEHRFIVAHQLYELGVKAHIILEPSSRNTAAAIAMVSDFVLCNDDMDNTLLVMPSDHHIEDPQSFQQTISQAESIAKQGYIVTFGIKPTHPETGYGYIQCAKKISETAIEIEKFVEKPDLETAKKYVQQDNYFWNAGIFMFDAQVMLEEFEQYTPQIKQVVAQAVAQGTRDLDFFRLGETFNQAQDISIDYAVMEKTQKGALIPLNAGWSDVGSFNAMVDFFPSEQDGNTILGEAVAIESSDNFIHSKNRLIGVLGIKELAIIDTYDALLITPKSRVQEIGKIVKKLKASADERTHFHSQVHRPWGWYETLIEDDTFKVKRINVYPGGTLSLQKHRYRSEHWVVVSGTATVTCDEKVFQLYTNQSTFIPCGGVHRLENKDSQNLQIIEIQNGTYLGEDDIVRIEDRYNRD